MIKLSHEIKGFEFPYKTVKECVLLMLYFIEREKEDEKGLNTYLIRCDPYYQSSNIFIYNLHVAKLHCQERTIIHIHLLFSNIVS